MLFSTNLSNGLFDLQVKLSLLLFPLSFIFIGKLNGRRLTEVLKSFIIGCVAASFLCISYASYQYYISYDLESFFYTNFSYYHHPSYFSMYLNLAFAIIIVNLIQRYKKLGMSRIIALMLPALLFSIVIFLLASKAGIICYSVLFMILALYYVIKVRNFIIGLSLLIIIPSTLLFIYRNSSVLQNRINESIQSFTSKEAIKKEYSPTTSIRIYIWKTSLNLIREKPLGYGTGSVKDVLVDKYKKDRFSFAEQKKLNAHNQFLQTTLAIGIPGLLLLLFMLLYPLKSLEGMNRLLFGILVLLFTVTGLTESLLETQSGVIFFAFFYPLFCSTRLSIPANKALKESTTH